MIDATRFKEATGHEPENDDLDRANCPDAGKLGHQDCGWNHTHNLPNFMVPVAQRGKE